MNAAFTHHGGDLAAAMAVYGGRAEDWIDLSTGINPRPWPVPADLSIDWHALPDRVALAALERAAAAFFGVDPAMCRAVPGSEAALRALAPILGLPGRHAALTYRTHAEAFDDAGVVDHSPGTGPTTLILANPNNPDGILRGQAELARLLAIQEAQSGWLILDEAFADCDPAASAIGLLAPHRRLIVLRSFGKFFGLAGVRLGFVIAPRGVLDALDRRLGAWPVNAAALAIGQAAYRDTAWITRTRRNLWQSAAALDTVLAGHALCAQGNCPLFRLVQADDAMALFDKLARRHILTRPFAQDRRLLRLGLPATDAALDRLDAALSGPDRHG